jgi:hypothetical protein
MGKQIYFSDKEIELLHYLIDLGAAEYNPRDEGSEILEKIAEKISK